MILTIWTSRYFGSHSVTTLWIRLALSFSSSVVALFLVALEGLIFERLWKMKAPVKPEKISGSVIVSIVGLVCGWFITSVVLVFITAIIFSFHPIKKKPVSVFEDGTQKSVTLPKPSPTPSGFGHK